MSDQTNLLSFSTRVDLSGAKAGMAELKDTISTQMASAADAVGAAGDAIETAFASIADASETSSASMQEAYAQMEAQGIETLAALNAATEEATAATVDSASESAAAVSDSADIQQAAYRQLAAATLDNALAQQQLSGIVKNLTGLDTDNAAVLDLVVAAQASATEAAAALADAKANLAEVTEYLNAETTVEMATTEGATVAARGLAQANEQMAASGGHSVSQIQAASGAIRVFEGTLPIRAVERFAVSTLGLGPILQAAFPIVGAVAFGEILVETVDKAEKAIDAVTQAGARITAAWNAEDNALRVSNDSLDITNDKLENTLAKLEHKPENGLALALDEARQSADKLSVSLQKDLDKSNELITKNHIGVLGEIMGKQGTGDAEKMIHDPKHPGAGINDQIQAVKDSYQQTIDDASESGATQQNIVDIKTAEMTHLEAVYANAEARIKPILHQMTQDMEMYRESGGGRGKDQTGNIAILQGYLAQLHEEQREIGASFREDTLKEQIAPLQADKANNSGANKAAEAKLRAMEAERALEIQQYGQNIKADHDYWEARIGAFETGGSQYLTVLQKITHDDEQGARLAHEAIEKYQKASTKPDSDKAAIDGMQKLAAEAEKTADNITRSGERWDEYYAQVTKASEITATSAENLEKANLAIAEEEGGIRALGATHITASMHAEEYRLKLIALQAELAKLRNQATIDPLTGANLDPKNAAQQQGVQNQIASTQGQQAVTGAKDNAATAQAISAPYLTAFNTINDGFLSVQQKMIMGTQNIGRDFAQMGAQLVVSVAAGFEKMLVKSAEFEIQSVIAHSAANTAKVTSDATAAAASKGINEESAIQTAKTNAGIVFGKVYGALAGIPIVGPVLAPIAASAAAASVFALAAFDTGGIIANTGVALVHKDEAVLPAPLTNLLMSTAGKGGTNNSSSSSMTQNNHFSGTTDTQFRNQMLRNSKTAMKSVHRQARSMGRA